MNRRRCVIAVLVLLGLCRVAGAQGEDLVMEVEVGWGGRFRPDRWTPAYVTAQARQPTPVILRWYVPRPGREAMVIEQSVVLNPERATHVAYLPIGPDPAAVHLTVADASTGRTLAHWPTSVLSPIEYADAQVHDGTFIGVSGAAPALRSLDDRRFKVAYLAPELLPREAIGYDGLDQLALNRPQLASLELEQQEAIAAWVRAGGKLVMWLDLQPLPEQSPLLTMLPAGGIAEFTYRRIGEDQVAYTRLRDAEEGSLVTRAAVGAGEIIFLHMAPDDAARQGAQLIQEARAGLGEPAALPAETIEAVRSAAGVSRLDGLIPLLATAVLIGPVDWLVLRRSQRRMRRWLTVPGWLALFVLLLWYLPSRPAGQTWVSLSVAAWEPPPAVAQATIATTGGRLHANEAQELARLDEFGTPYWRTLGTGRVRGILREVVFVQGDDAMVAGRANEQPPAFIAEGTVFPQ